MPYTPFITYMYIVTTYKGLKYAIYGAHSETPNMKFIKDYPQRTNICYFNKPTKASIPPLFLKRSNNDLPQILFDNSSIKSDCPEFGD